MVWIEKSVTQDHCLASLLIPVSDPRDRFFYPHHTPMKDTYNIITQPITVLSYLVQEGGSPSVSIAGPSTLSVQEGQQVELVCSADGKFFDFR